jgi:hypothetical protein
VRRRQKSTPPIARAVGRWPEGDHVPVDAPRRARGGLLANGSRRDAGSGGEEAGDEGWAVEAEERPMTSPEPRHACRAPWGLLPLPSMLGERGDLQRSFLRGRARLVQPMRALCEKLPVNLASGLMSKILGVQ